MPSYLTQYVRERQYKRPCPDTVWLTKIAGPDIEADSWDEAAMKLLVLIEFGMVHPETEVIGKLYHEEEWEGYYDGRCA